MEIVHACPARSIHILHVYILNEALMTEGSVVLGNHTQITTIFGEVKYI